MPMRMASASRTSLPSDTAEGPRPRRDARLLHDQERALIVELGNVVAHVVGTLSTSQLEELFLGGVLGLSDVTSLRDFTTPRGW